MSKQDDIRRQVRYFKEDMRSGLQDMLDALETMYMSIDHIDMIEYLNDDEDREVSEINRLAVYLMDHWSHRIDAEGAVDTAIKLLEELRGTQDEEKTLGQSIFDGPLLQPYTDPRHIHIDGVPYDPTAGAITHIPYYEPYPYYHAGSDLSVSQAASAPAIMGGISFAQAAEFESGFAKQMREDATRNIQAMLAQQLGKPFDPS